MAVKEKRDPATMTLIEKLAAIQDLVDVVKKDKKGFNYKYVDINEILAKVKGGMKSYRVSLIPIIVPETSDVQQLTVVNTKFDKQGNMYEQTSTEMLVTFDMLFKWINNDNPEEVIEVPWFIAGSQADPSQALGSGLKYGKRQFLVNYFHIAEEEGDIEQYRKKQKEAEEQQDIEVASSIIAEVDKLVKQYLADNADKRDEVLKFISKYIKGSNYLKIKEPALAAKLLEDFKNTYGSQED